MPTPNKVHQADLLFFSHDSLGGGRGQRAYKYVLTVVDVGSERQSWLLHWQKACWGHKRKSCCCKACDFLQQTVGMNWKLPTLVYVRYLTKRLSWKAGTNVQLILFGHSTWTTLKNLSPNHLNLYCIIWRMGPNEALSVSCCWLCLPILFFLQQLHDILMQLLVC